MIKSTVGMLVVVVVYVLILLSGRAFPAPPLPPVPADYADKHMPDGWWTDPKIIAEGKKVFTGQAILTVNCSSCHGKDGKPKKRGARDLRDPKNVSRFSDSF